MEGAVCVMDPVFFDPFEEGAVVSCPRRTVSADKLPPIDTLIVSHRHPDHFDLRSLARIPRDCDAIVPADPLIVYALQKLGFRHIHPVHPMAPISSESFALFPTKSEAPGVEEFGMVFRDGSGTFWNQVDSFLSAETIGAVAARFGRPDLLFAMYASQNFDFFENRSTDFPVEVHRRNLQNVLRIGPGTVTPAAGGFRFRGAHAWLNAFLFPISRERFVADLKGLGFEGAAVVMNPGDVFEIADGSVIHRPGESEVAEMVEDDTARIRFDPTAPMPDLKDPNPEGYPKAKLERIATSFVGEALAGYVRAGDNTGDRLIALYRQHRVRYAVGLVFPDGETRWYRFDFGVNPVRLGTGPRADADIVHKIAASALAQWIEHKKSYFYVRGYSRRYQTLCEMSAEATEVRLKRRPLPDLLMHYLLNEATGSETAAKHQVDLELEDIRSKLG